MSKGLLIGGFVIIVALTALLIFVPRDKDTTVNTDDSLFGLSFKDSDGNSVSLSDFKGTPLIVNSWAVWCPFCVKELSDFKEAQKELGDSVIIIAIDRQESLSLTKQFTDDLGVTDDLIFWLDPDDSFHKKIGGVFMPQTLFIDSEGVIKDHKRGPMEKDEIIQRAQAIL